MRCGWGVVETVGKDGHQLWYQQSRLLVERHLQARYVCVFMRTSLIRWVWKKVRCTLLVRLAWRLEKFYGSSSYLAMCRNIPSEFCSRDNFIVE